MSQPFGSDSAPVGDAGSGSIGADATGSAVSTGAVPGQSDSGNSGNGAWSELLGGIPREFHPALTPHLQKFDSNYGKLSQDYAPWKKTFADKGVTPEDLLGYQRLYDLVNSNPALVYAQLGQHLENLRRAQPGYQEQQQQQQGQPQYQQNQQFQQQGFQQGQPQQFGQSGQPQEFEGFDDPRLQMLYQQNQQMMQWFQQQQMMQQQQQVAAQEKAMTDDYEKKLSSGIAAIQKKDPTADIGDLLQRAYVQVAQGGEPDLNKAYAEQQAFVQKIRTTPSAAAGAPTVMPTGGGIPPTIDTSRPKTNAEKAAKVTAMIEAARSQG